MSYLIRRVLAKPRLILDEMYRLYGKFASYLRRALCKTRHKTRLIFPRINGPNVASFCTARPTFLGWFAKSYGLYPFYDALLFPTLFGDVAFVCTPLPTRTQLLQTLGVDASVCT